MRLAAEHGIDPALMHRVAVIGSGTLDSLPHNGGVVTLLAVCGTTHRESYLDIVMVAVVSAIIALERDAFRLGHILRFGNSWRIRRR
jgi:H+/gluconate symporter-like permease